MSKVDATQNKEQSIKDIAPDAGPLIAILKNLPVTNSQSRIDAQPSKTAKHSLDGRETIATKTEGSKAPIDKSGEKTSGLGLFAWLSTWLSTWPSKFFPSLKISSCKSSEAESSGAELELENIPDHSPEQLQQFISLINDVLARVTNCSNDSSVPEQTRKKI